MNKFVLLSMLLLLIINNVNSWTIQFGTDRFDQAYDIAKDASNNLYIVGYTGGNLGGSNQQYGWYDVFVRKVSASSGAETYTEIFGTTNNEYARSIVVDDTYMYITGWTQGSFIGYTNQGYTDIFLSKRLLSTGAQSYTKQYGTTAHDHAYDMTLDASSIYVVGYTGGVLGSSSFGASDAYVRKFTKYLGVVEWTSQFGSNDQDFARGITIDSSLTYLYVCGQTWDSFPTFTNNGYGDTFVRKMYASNGNEIWLKQFGGAGNDNALSLVVVNTAIYITGQTDGYINGTAGTFNYDDAYVQKLNESNGDVIWINQFGAAAGNDVGETIRYDNTHLYVSGKTYGCCLGSSSQGLEDAFVTRISLTDGERLWTEQYGTSADEMSRGMVVETTSNVLYVSGATKGTLATTNAGDYDAFAKKFTTPTPSPTPAPTAAPYPYDYIITNNTELLSGGNLGYLDALSMNENNIVAIASSTQMNSSSNGLVEIYKRNLTNDYYYRTHQIYKENFEFGENFAYAIQLDKTGNRLLVSSDKDRVYIYLLQDDNYILESVLLPNKTDPYSNILFGKSLSLTDDIAVIGAFANNEVFLFRRNESDNNNWHDDDYIKGLDGTNFGYAVAISIDKNVLAISANNLMNDDNNNNRGAVYMYLYNSTNSKWYNVFRIDVPTSPSFLQEFGRLIAMSKDGSVLVISAMANNVYVYNWQTNNNTWTFSQNLNDSAILDVDSLDINDDGSTIVIGSSSSIAPGTNGLVLIFTLDGDIFTKTLTLNGIITDNLLGFGASVSIAGDGYGLACSAPQYNNIGGVFMFSNIGPTRSPTKSPTLSPSNSPSVAPSNVPSEAPSEAPSNIPSEAPSEFPSSSPSQAPSAAPNTPLPTPLPTNPMPSEAPSEQPSNSPSNSPTNSPTDLPSEAPSQQPTDLPSEAPSIAPSEAPTTPFPTNSPTIPPPVTAGSAFEDPLAVTGLVIGILVGLIILVLLYMWCRKRKGHFSFSNRNEFDTEMTNAPKYRKETVVATESSQSWEQRNRMLHETIPNIMAKREAALQKKKSNKKQNTTTSSQGNLNYTSPPPQHQTTTREEKLSIDDEIPPPSLSRLFTPTEDLNLPEDWARYFDDEKHLPYYYNHKTGESTWVKPTR